MNKWILMFLFSAILLTNGCTVPQYIWPQKDVDFQEVNHSSLENKILIASRKSEFKSEVVKRIENAFKNQTVYIKIIGIEGLKNENAKKYSAVVLLNTAMAWEIDRKARYFLDKYKDMNSIIVLTTSGGGDVLPDAEEYQIDAVTSASGKDETEDVANKIINKIEKLIKK